MKIRSSFLIVVLLLSGLATSWAAQDHKPWNVVFFLVDDLGWADLGYAGSDFYQTPHVDQLAADGVKFSHAYAATNCCSPTRGALMTGMYPARTHLTDWIPGWRQQYTEFKLLPPLWTQKLELRHTTIAEALHDAGYATFHLGKWHLGDEAHAPEYQGFDLNVGGTALGGPRSYQFPYGGDAMKWDSVLSEQQREGRYLTDRLADEAVALIDQHKDRPFFLNFSFFAVHTPVKNQGRPDLVEKYQKLAPGKNQHNPNYAAMVESMDEAVGRVRAELERVGVADHTLVIFTSDNGAVARDISNNAPLRGQKGQHWEGGERVPTIVYWPGVTPAGSTSAEPIITMDFYPTILEVTGVAGDSAHNGKVDGLSLSAVLRNPADQLDRDALFWHYPHYNPLIGVPYGTVRTRNYKLIEYFEDQRLELYDLATDIGEKHDLSRAQPAMAARLRGLLHNFRQRTGAQMPVPNPNFDPNSPFAANYYAMLANEMADPETLFEDQLTDANRSLIKKP